MSELTIYPNGKKNPFVSDEEFNVNKVKIALNGSDTAYVDIDLTKICHINKLEVTTTISPSKKKFDDLKEGDTLYVWWTDTLYICKIYKIEKLKHSFEGQAIDNEYVIKILTDNERTFYVSNDYRQEEAFIYGIDGWHEYEIIGTSKESVGQQLATVLDEDERDFKLNKENWLKEFE